MPDETPNGAPQEPTTPTPAAPQPVVPAEPSETPEAPEPTTPVEPNGQPPKGGVPVWVWVLVGVGALGLIGGGIALVMMMMASKPQPLPLNTATDNTINWTNNAANNAANEAAEIDKRSDDTVTFMEGTVEVIDGIGAALEDWSTAADLGAEGDFAGSTAALEDGLAKVEDIEAILEDLNPNSETAALYDLLVEAVAKSRLAMEKGIEGNETDNIDAINESGQAVEDLAALLDEISIELDSISESVSSDAV